MPIQPSSKVGVRLAAAALAASVAALMFAFLSDGTSERRTTHRVDVDALLRQAIADIERGDLDAGQRQLDEVLRAVPNHSEALLYLGQLAEQDGDRDAAFACWDRVPDTAGRFAATARYLEGMLRLELHQARPAEHKFQRSVELKPTYLAPHERLLELYVAQMRAADIREQLVALEKLRPLTLDELVLEIVADDRILPLGQGIEVNRAFLQTDPSDVESRLALARYLSEEHADEAAALLEEFLAAHPQHETACALLVGILLDEGDLAAARRLLKDRRPMETSPAVVWEAFGRLSEASGEWSAASAAYVEAVRRRPHDGTTRYRLGQSLARSGEPSEAARQLDRARLLDELNSEAFLVSRAVRERRSATLLSAQVATVAGILNQLGRAKDAELWFGHSLDVDPSNLVAREGYRQAREAVVVAFEDSLPRPSVPGVDGKATAAAADVDSPQRAATPGAPIRFAAAEFEFSYFNGATGNKYLVETVGGGVAVLDYDGDGWPDLYCCQGSDLPHVPANREWNDRLFRNRGDGTFEDVTAAAGIAEHGYSIGCTAADVDNDGDPDLYVTNHGRDTLLLNNGDGTFRDVTEKSGLTTEAMSSSAAFADLDADGDLDLYVATYVESLRICRSADGTISTCDPRNHQGPPDFVYRNNGDGTFSDVSAESGVAAARDGKGLGVLVADLDSDGRQDIYVANDTTPNFLFFNRTEPGGPIRLQGGGLASGTALNGNGEAEAGMGIACADFDGDGLPDLHVTNFYLESNTLYRNLGGGLFADVTTVAGLSAPTIPWLGFGTQAADFDLDGDPDLFVANGHIDDFRSRGEPWKMPAQLFRNTGGLQFDEVSESGGPYFVERSLGRGVARLDWNRDGRPDLAVVHQDRPAALLTNETTAGESVSIRLHGIRSNRDGIGARLRVTAGTRTQTLQVCGGDGIVCSNERVQIVGLGDAARIDRLEVTWPSGERTIAHDLPAGKTLLVIEGRAPCPLER